MCKHMCIYMYVMVPMPCWSSCSYVLGRLWHQLFGTLRLKTPPRFSRSPLGWSDRKKLQDTVSLKKKPKSGTSNPRNQCFYLSSSPINHVGRQICSLFCTNTLRQGIQLPLFFSMFLLRSAVGSLLRSPRCCGRRTFLVRCLPVNKQLGQFPEDETESVYSLSWIDIYWVEYCLFPLPIGLPSFFFGWVCSSRMTSGDRHCNYIPQVIFNPYDLLKPGCLILVDGYTCRGLHYSIQWEKPSGKRK